MQTTNSQLIYEINEYIRTMNYGMRNIGNVFFDENGILSELLTEICQFDCCEVKLIN